MTRSDSRHSHLPANLPPRGLSREAAAEYIGVSPRKFDELVAAARVAKPIHVDGRRIWDRHALDRGFDQSFDALGGDAKHVNEWNDGA